MNMEQPLGDKELDTIIEKVESPTQETEPSVEQIVNRVLQEEEDVMQLMKFFEHEKIILMDGRGMLHTDWKVKEFTEDPATHIHLMTLWSAEGNTELTITLKEFQQQRLRNQ
jgi:hypothetical protein